MSVRISGRSTNQAFLFHTNTSFDQPCVNTILLFRWQRIYAFYLWIK